MTIMLSVCLIWLTGCHSDSVSTPEESGKSNTPAFVISSKTQTDSSGDIEVSVCLKDNIGFLTMAANIEYDESAMTLVEIENGADFGEYNFVGPKNMQSGCMASWFSPDLPEEIKDGELLTLHFAVSENVESGEYPITITCPDDDGILSGDMEPITIESTTEYIKIR